MVPLVDAHCHLRTRVDGEGGSVPRDGTLRCVMSCNEFDWALLEKEDDASVAKSFGVHPWYSHLYTTEPGPVDKERHYKAVLEWKDDLEFGHVLAALPDPTNLSTYIDQHYDTNTVSVIGEIGLDRLFRLPETGFYTDGAARLTTVRVKYSHQQAIFRRMCQLAAKHSKPVSIHNVKSQDALFTICCEQLLPNAAVNLCLHSYTGSAQSLRNNWIKTFRHRLFASLFFADAANSERQIQLLLQEMPPAGILTETDCPVDAHDNTTVLLQQMCERISQALSLDGRQLVYDNYTNFLARDTHVPPT